MITEMPIHCAVFFPMHHANGHPCNSEWVWAWFHERFPGVYGPLTLSVTPTHHWVVIHHDAWLGGGALFMEAA